MRLRACWTDSVRTGNNLVLARRHAPTGVPRPRWSIRGLVHFPGPDRGQICHSGELKTGIFIPFLYVSECTGRGNEDLVQLRESGNVLFKSSGRLLRILVNTEPKVAQPAWWTTLPTCRNA